MSDRMVPMPFSKLMNWVLKEYHTNKSIFSVKKCFIKNDSDKIYSIFGEKMETIFGPAAGPHTQLAQNIIAAYFAGARFFELKTVQILDGEDLQVPKPCIYVRDEGYNVEWSTELSVREAMNEYIKAWFALKLISQEFHLGNPEGFIFNMSVGYDLEGIKSEKIDTFIEGLKNAENTEIWKECKEFATRHIELFENIDKRYIELISPRICTSVTLSTLHGCPPDEIERIAIYLLKEKNLHTFIKCNPTLLGYTFVRKTMDDMGYDYLAFDEHHFKNDLHYKDALPMFARLFKLASKKELTFGVKLTNTFPVKIINNELEGEEMYMSGTALYPLTIALANKLTQAFDGKLKISFSGGADAFNIKNLSDCNIMPVTMATTLLKPGGYARMTQIAENLEEDLGRHSESEVHFEGINKDALKTLSLNAINDRHHVKGLKNIEPYKGSTPLTISDCFLSPCEEGCPIGQDISEYISLAGRGDYKKALEVIMDKNPLPFITGTICNHKCMGKCIRNFYEESVHIRDVKLESAKNAYEDVLSDLEPCSSGEDKKTAVIGGGPAGMAAAYFLAKAGVKVTIFEKEEHLGGKVKYVVPGFRISDEAIEKDISFIKALGVEIKNNTMITNEKQLLEAGYKNIILAVGADVPVSVDIKEAHPIYGVDFLKDFKENKTKLGKNVVVVGGGNTAMDVARAAKRTDGVEKVSLVYRRTIKLMPAIKEEINQALEDGVLFYELTNPISLDNEILICEKMGEKVYIEADDIILATGERPDTDFINNFSGHTYKIGDCLDKPKTVVEAIRDARMAVDSILNVEAVDKCEYKKDCMNSIYDKKGILKHACNEHESNRCLQCRTLCENCVDVCPNRANVEILSAGHDMPQILHIDDMCNECGNCGTFCPTAGLPYKDKLTLFGSKDSMENSDNSGFYIDKKTGEAVLSRNLEMDEKVNSIINAVKENYSYLI